MNTFYFDGSVLELVRLWFNFTNDKSYFINQYKCNTLDECVLFEDEIVKRYYLEDGLLHIECDDPVDD